MGHPHSPRFPPAYYETRFELEREPPAAPFAIITAHNPMDRRFSRRMNRRADHKLRRLLERKHLPHFRATGRSPDDSHREPGWAVTTSLETAVALARRYRQRALWWIEDDRLELIAASDPAIRESLGIFRERLIPEPPHFKAKT